MAVSEDIMALAVSEGTAVSKDTVVNRSMAVREGMAMRRTSWQLARA